MNWLLILKIILGVEGLLFNIVALHFAFVNLVLSAKSKAFLIVMAIIGLIGYVLLYMFAQSLLYMSIITIAFTVYFIYYFIQMHNLKRIIEGFQGGV